MTWFLQWGSWFTFFGYRKDGIFAFYSYSSLRKADDRINSFSAMKHCNLRVWYHGLLKSMNMQRLSESASSYCISKLCTFIGPNIFKARLNSSQLAIMESSSFVVATISAPGTGTEMKESQSGMWGSLSSKNRVQQFFYSGYPVWYVSDEITQEVTNFPLLGLGCWLICESVCFELTLTGLYQHSTSFSPWLLYVTPESLHPVPSYWKLIFITKRDVFTTMCSDLILLEVVESG